MTELSQTDHLRGLGEKSEIPLAYNKAVLERIPSPYKALGLTGIVELHHDYAEFTSNCPKTGAPDFARMHIYYKPDEWLVESKSIKLYFNSFRNERDFHEACAARICRDLADLLNPHNIEVWAEFTPRGGVAIWPKVRWDRAETGQFLGAAPLGG